MRTSRRYPGLFKGAGKKTVNGRDVRYESCFWSYRYTHPVTKRRMSAPLKEADAKKAWECVQGMNLTKLDDGGDKYLRNAYADVVGFIDEWRQSLALATKNNTPRYIKLKVERGTKILRGCKATNWADVSERRVEAYISRLDVSDRTRHHYAQAIRQFATWLTNSNPLKRITADNPVASLAVKVSSMRHERRPLSVAERRQLFARVSAEDATRFRITAADRVRLYRFAFASAMRQSEIRALTWRRISLTSRAATVPSAYRKTHKPRTVMLPDYVVRLLQAWRAERSDEPLDTPIFRMPSEYSVARMLRADMDAARPAWIADAGTDREPAERDDTTFLVYHEPDLTGPDGRIDYGRYADFHACRHATAHDLIRGGAPVKVTQDVLGHRAAKMTLDIYAAHAMEPEQKAAMNLLPDVGDNGQDAERRAG